MKNKEGNGDYSSNDLIISKISTYTVLSFGVINASVSYLEFISATSLNNLKKS